MKLFLVSQDVNNNYNTYGDAVVCAADADAAARVKVGETLREWCRWNRVKVAEIGEALPGVKKGVVLASFRGE